MLHRLRCVQHIFGFLEGLIGLDELSTSLPLFLDLI